MKLFSAALELKAIKSIAVGSYSDGENVEITPMSLSSSLLLASMDESFFYSEPCKAAFNRIVSVAKKKSKVPSFDDLLEDLALNEEYRDVLRESRKKKKIARSEKQAHDLLDQLDDYRKTRSLYFMAKNVIEQLNEAEVDVNLLMDETTDRITKARSRELMVDAVLTVGANSNADDLAERAMQPDDEPLLKTGFTEYDERNGGLPSEGVMLLASTTSGGKSVTRMNLMTNLYKLNKISVGTVSLEMNAKKETRRLLSRLTGIAFWKFNRRRLNAEETALRRSAWKKFCKFGVKNDCSYSLLCPTRGLTIQQLLMLVKPYGFKAIAIDYISLLEGADGQDQWKVLSSITRECKIFSAENKCLVILLAQLDSEDDRIRYSKGILEHCDNCITGDALIETPKGLVRLDSLVEAEGKAKVISKFPVVSEGSAVHASAWMYRGEKPVRKITTDRGFELKGTDDHRIKVLTKDLDIAWRNIGEVRAGEYVAIDRSVVWSVKDAPVPMPVFDAGMRGKRVYSSWTPTMETHMTPALAAVMGHLMAEGTINTRMVEFVTSEMETARHYVDSFKSAFGQELTIAIHDGGKFFRVRTDRKWTVQFFNQLPGFTGGASKKYIPACVLGSTKSVVAAFLQAMFEGDGGKGDTTVHYYSTSALLSKQVHMLLLKFGIVSKRFNQARMNPFNGKRALRMHTVQVGGFDNLTQFSKNVGFISTRKSVAPKSVTFKKCSTYLPYVGAILRSRHHGSRNGVYSDFKLFGLVEDSHKLAFDKITPSAMGRLQLTDPEIHQKLNVLMNCGYMWERVKSNRSAGIEKVYDITVPATSSFIANGFVVHNCWIWNYSGQEQRDMKTLPVKQLKARDQELFGFDLKEHFEIMTVLNPTDPTPDVKDLNDPTGGGNIGDDDVDPLKEADVQYDVG